jgi:hypothetical protein
LLERWEIAELEAQGEKEGTTREEEAISIDSRW